MTALLILGVTLVCVASLLLVLGILRGGTEADEARSDALAVAALAQERARNEMRERIDKLMREHRR